MVGSTPIANMYVNAAAFLTSWSTSRLVAPTTTMGMVMNRYRIALATLTGRFEKFPPRILAANTGAMTTNTVHRPQATANIADTATQADAASYHPSCTYSASEVHHNPATNADANTNKSRTSITAPRPRYANMAKHPTVHALETRNIPK
jgi:hypothetical protein